MKVNIRYSKLEEKESIVKSALQVGGVVLTTVALGCGFVAFQLVCANNAIPVDEVAFKAISSVL